MESAVPHYRTPFVVLVIPVTPSEGGEETWNKEGGLIFRASRHACTRESSPMHASTQKQPPLKRPTVAAGRLGAALPCEHHEFREPWRGPAAFLWSWGALEVSKRCVVVQEGTSVQSESWVPPLNAGRARCHIRGVGPSPQ